jgi:hypothetical protein
MRPLPKALSQSRADTIVVPGGLAYVSDDDILGRT